jgi:phage baseplate assembly protein gpV
LLGAGTVTLVDGDGASWNYDRAAHRRFWKRAVSLRETLGEAAE